MRCFLAASTHLVRMFLLPLALSCPALAETAPVKAQAQAGEKSAGTDPTQTIMDALFEPMSQLVAVGFDKDQFSAVAQRTKVEGLLERLVANSDRLEKHAETRDRSFEYVARSLRRDARTALRRYQRGQFEEARFTIFNMTDNCIACHSSLPEGRKFPGSDRFFAKIDSKNLPPLERAHYQLMSRQFDAALATMETYFESREVDPALVPLLGAFTTYMKVSINVKSDFQRPQAVLRRLLALPSMPVHVRMQVERWLTALAEFEKSQPLQTPTLANARKIIADGKAMMEYPRDRDGLVQYLTAEAILHRYIQSKPDRGSDVAEAYYLLGIVTSVSENSYWITRSDFYLESAIRLAPGAPFAVKAYRMLDESLVGGFTGSSGANVPEDVVELLNELKKIVEQARGRRI